VSEVIIRPATVADGETLLALIDGLAEYEKLTPPDDAGRKRLLDHLETNEYFDALIAEVDGEAVGYAVFFNIYSTFSVKPKLYMEDLFVRPEFRSTKAGYALVRRLAEIAIERRCSGIEWEVLDWNQLAIDFYERIGGEHDTRWLRYNLSEEAMRNLVAGS
jgi:GNAT superfamily N-acetyltransferase